MYHPVFIDIEFEGADLPNPFTPVAAVNLGYLRKDDSLASWRFVDFHDDAWSIAADFIQQWHNQMAGEFVPVGYNLRNLVWPAFTLNMAKHRIRLPQSIMMPMEKKWNSLDMVDLQQLLVQGGYSDFRPTLDETCAFFEIPVDGRTALDKIKDLFLIYNKL